MTTSAPMDVGIIESDPDQRKLIARILERAGFTTAWADDLERGFDLLQQKYPKVILCDYDQADVDGAELCALLRHGTARTPSHIILMSSEAREELSNKALEAGADDYLPMPVASQELIARVRMGTRMWTMHDQLRRAAITDGLTGLYNHDHFNRVLDVEMGRSRRYGHPMAIIMIDMDHFKAINDTYGHLVGNSTLEEVAGVLRDGVRDIDAVARFGGDEFAVVLPEATTEDARQVAERLRAILGEGFALEALRDHAVSASFGIADSEDPRVGCSADLVDLADRALYVAKHRGRNQVACSTEFDEGAEFAAAIKTDEIDWLRRRIAALHARTKDVYMQSVAALLQALDEKDPYTARHAMNVASYAQQIAEQMGCSKATTKSVYNAALLHDIGKVGVPDRILMKRTPLTSLERMVLDQVPLIGTRIVDHLRILESEIQIIRHQREHYDGTGFPAGLQGNQIPVGSRILLAADAFDAMTTDRVYRRRRPIDDVMTELQQLAGAQFDPRTVTALRQVLDKHRELWEQRIQETIRAMHLPSDSRLMAVPHQDWADSS